MFIGYPLAIKSSFFCWNSDLSVYQDNVYHFHKFFGKLPARFRIIRYEKYVQKYTTFDCSEKYSHNINIRQVHTWLLLLLWWFCLLHSCNILKKKMENPKGPGYYVVELSYSS